MHKTLAGTMCAFRVSEIVFFCSAKGTVAWFKNGEDRGCDGRCGKPTAQGRRVPPIEKLCGGMGDLEGI